MLKGVKGASYEVVSMWDSFSSAERGAKSVHTFKRGAQKVLPCHDGSSKSCLAFSPSHKRESAKERIPFISPLNVYMHNYYRVSSGHNRWLLRPLVP